MPHPPSTRYVILEWTESGSSSPLVGDTSAYSSLIDAHDAATDLESDAKRDGRPNTFTVHAVDMDVIAR